MKIAISGGTGFIGQHLQSLFHKKECEFFLIPRSAFGGDPSRLAGLLKDAQVVIHLSGAPVVGRWTKKYRRQIYDSRIQSTRFLVQAMSLMPEKPDVLLCASAVGIYPGIGINTEENTRIADGFLGEVCRDWEHEAMQANGFTRVILLRFGTVLGKNGGALKTMMLPFRMGLGGRIGSGNQMISWVHVEDLVRAVWYTITKKSIHGPVNITAPTPVSNKEFTRVLAQIMRRPAWFPVPIFMLKLLYGDGASVVTEGQHVLPKKLQQAGFQFNYPMLEAALSQIIRKAYRTPHRSA
jgi:uncharacterized protein